MHLQVSIDTTTIGNECHVFPKSYYIVTCVQSTDKPATYLQTATNTHMQAVVSRLNTVAAIIGVQDSLQHVGPQLWFLQSLLGHAVAILHTLVQRSLQHVNPHNQGLMHSYLSGHAQYAATTALEPGECCL